MVTNKERTQAEKIFIYQRKCQADDWTAGDWKAGDWTAGDWKAGDWKAGHHWLVG